LSLKDGDKVKKTFWGTDPHEKDCLYQWKFFPFGLKNALIEFQRVMDQMLTGLSFAKFHIDDIIHFSLTLEDHMHHLQEMFRKLQDHNLKFHLGKCQFFNTQVEYLGHMIYLGGLGVQKAKIEAISLVPQATNVSWLRAFLGLYNYYRTFVKGFSSITKPRINLTSNRKILGPYPPMKDLGIAILE